MTKKEKIDKIVKINEEIMGKIIKEQKSSSGCWNESEFYALSNENWWIKTTKLSMEEVNDILKKKESLIV